MEVLFYIFVTTIPSHIIPFSMFWRFPWRSRKAALFLVFCNVLCKMAAASYCMVNDLYFRNLEFLFAVVGFLIYVLFLRMDFSKLLFTYILIVDYLLVIRGISSFVAVRLCQAPSQAWIGSFVCVLLYLVSLPLLLRFFRQVAGQVYRTHAPRLWRTIWLVPGLFTLLTLMSTNSYLETSAKSWFFLFCRISLLICIFVIYYVLLQALENLRKQIAMEQQMIFEKHLLGIQIKEQKKYSQLMVENAEQLRRQRHDLRHQLTVIQGLSQDDNTPLKQYIEQLFRAIPVAPTVYCENQAVNAIVSHYAALCEAQKIAADIRITVPTHTEHTTDTELCVIFGNLLENAVEACRRMTEGEKFLRLSSRVEHGVLTIAMDNSFDGKVAKEEEKFLSSKRSGVGIGLSSIRSVAKAHQGDARFEAEGTVFHSSVYCRL